ncbi:hypothetical protein Dimus_035431 [Dionaea muscipula]
MVYVIGVRHHELPNGEMLTRVFEAFEVPLDDKEENVEEKKEESEKTVEENFGWEQVNEEEVEVQGEPKEKEVVIDDSRFKEEFFDVVEEERTVDEGVTAPAA